MNGDILLINIGKILAKCKIPTYASNAMPAMPILSKIQTTLSNMPIQTISVRYHFSKI